MYLATRKRTELIVMHSLSRLNSNVDGFGTLLSAEEDRYIAVACSRISALQKTGISPFEVLMDRSQNGIGNLHCIPPQVS